MIALPNYASPQACNLVSWYPLGNTDSSDKIAFDRAQARHNLTLYTSASAPLTLEPGLCGLSRRCGRSVVQHYHTNGALNIPNNRINASGEMSISCWVYFNSAPSFMNIFGNANHLSGGQWGVLYADYSLYPTFATTGNTTVNLTNSVAVTTGVWTHYCGTAGKRGVNLYQNGRLIASSGTSQTFSVCSMDWYIGGTGLNGTAYQLDGRIMDCRIYDRALMPEEVHAMYGRGRWDLWLSPMDVSAKAASTSTKYSWWAWNRYGAVA